MLALAKTMTGTEWNGERQSVRVFAAFPHIPMHSSFTQGYSWSEPGEPNRPSMCMCACKCGLAVKSSSISEEIELWP